MKKDLIWMDFIIDKMIEYGLRAVNKQMLMVEFIEKQSFLKVLWYVLGACYEGVTRPVIIETGTINHQRYIQKILPLALQDGRKING